MILNHFEQQWKTISLFNMTKEEIIEALENDMLLPYMQDWELERIVDFVIENYEKYIWLWLIFVLQ